MTSLVYRRRGHKSAAGLGMAAGGRLVDRFPTLLWSRRSQAQRGTEKVGLQLAGALLAGGTASAVSSSPWASCSAAIAVAAAAAETGKAYVVKPSILNPFAPMSLAQVVLIGAAIPFNAQLESATKRFQAAQKAGGELGVTHNEDGEGLTPFNLIDLEKMKVECAYNCGKSMTNKLLLKAAHLALWHYLDGEGGQHQIAKIIKDVAASAVSSPLSPQSLWSSNPCPSDGGSVCLFACLLAHRSARLCAQPTVVAAT